jgi:MinD-like ATPase involved in chromosome partitioning or flagellar assembly
MNGTVLALVGAVGGAGTTRLSLEVGATAARTGRSVAVVDASYGTQGLAMAVAGTLDPDVTTVVTEDEPLERALVETGLDVDGRLAVAPARAPFERLARAKTSDCARRLAERLATAAERFDVVVVDVPPVAANQAVAAVTAADRVGVVVPDARRGADALAPARDRLRDVDASADATVATRVGEERIVESSDVGVPTAPAGERALADAPTSHEGAGEFAAGVASVTEALLDVQVDVEFGDDGALDWLA